MTCLFFFLHLSNFKFYLSKFLIFLLLIPEHVSFCLYVPFTNIYTYLHTCSVCVFKWWGRATISQEFLERTSHRVCNYNMITLLYCMLPYLDLFFSILLCFTLFSTLLSFVDWRYIYITNITHTLFTFLFVIWFSN